MITMKKSLASAIATGALFVNTALPAFAVTIEVSGNGSDSTSTVGTSLTNTTTVVQSNTANISNNVNADASSGGNRVDGTTGGNVTLRTGDSSVGVGITNTANSNTASVNGLGQNNNADVLVAGNGSDSSNAVSLGLSNTTAAFQNNVANFDNNVNADARTGRNRVDDTTGGDVLVDTGNASVVTLLNNTANANSLRIGNGLGSAQGGSVSARVIGNGADSVNTIGLSAQKSLTAVQNNYASIQNDVDADASTGGNDIDESTGGDSAIFTGDATVEVGIDNMANFNAADLGSGYLTDVLAKVSGNGADSSNLISANLYDAQSAFQSNDYSCGNGLTDLWFYYDPSACNEVDANAKTGYNGLDDSTNWGGTDPMVDTGDSNSTVVIENTGNANVLGSSSQLLPFDVNFGFGLNWLNLWAGFSNQLS